MHSSRMRTAHSHSRLLGGVCLSACWDTPPGPGHPPCVGLETSPLGMGLETPPARPVNLPLGVGLEIPPGQNPQPTPLGVGLETPLPLARPLNAPPGCGPGDTPPVWAWRPPSQTLNFPPGCWPGDHPPARPLNFPRVWS